MTINERIKAAVEPIVSVCEPDMYAGNEDEYCVFNYTEIPDGHGDNAPGFIRYLVQIHYYLPINCSPMQKKRQLCRALLEADFTYPTVENASDEICQHYVLECEGLEGVA